MQKEEIEGHRSFPAQKEKSGFPLPFDIQKLYKEYLTLEIPNPFTLQDIHNRLTKKYAAKEVDKNIFSSLKLDPHARFETVVTAYIFREKKAIKELYKLNKEEELFELHDINYIVNSEDNIHRSGATTHGMSYLLALESEVFWGIDQNEMFIGNERFEEYLILLYLTGYIYFENDPFINQLLERYKEGYYLRYFGVHDGQEKYLYK